MNISSVPSIKFQDRQTRRRFGGLHPLCGIGVVSRIEVTRIPARAIALIADSRPPPGPFTRTSTSRIPASDAFRAASPAACWAAKGVPLREPLKPRAPDEDCATRLPWVSVIEIKVLLKEAEICTIPIGIFFLSFFLNVFFFAGALAIKISDCDQPAEPLPTARRFHQIYFLPGAFFLATAALRGPFLVRAFVEVRWPRTGKLRR